MKRSFLILFCLWSTCTLWGCGAAPEESSAAEPLVVNIGCIPEFSHCAYTIEELAADSHVIAEGIVTLSEGFVPDNGMDVICTRMQITPLAVYKGTFHGETLLSYGGTMNLGAYYAAIGQTGLPYTAQELQTGIIHYEWANNSAPQTGDRILFFGQYAEKDPGTLWNTNVTQGIYLCDDETLSTSALLVDENGFTEPLAKDILARCGGTVSAPMEENGLPILTFDRKAFLEIIG